MLDIIPQANMHMLFRVRSQIQNFMWTSSSALKTPVVQQDSETTHTDRHVSKD